jgi:hypothetical protein
VLQNANEELDCHRSQEGEDSMRPVIAMLALVAAFALPATAQASATKTTAINATLVGDGCGVTGLTCGVGGGGSCVCDFAFWSFAGHTIIPTLGALAFTGFYRDGFFCSDIGNDLDCLVPLTYTRLLTLTLTAPSGDKLVLGENFASSTPQPLLSQGDNPVGGQWSVDPAQSTGRFTRYTGSGTYTLGAEDHYTYETFTLALQGTLTFH